MLPVGAEVDVVVAAAAAVGAGNAVGSDHQEMIVEPGLGLLGDHGDEAVAHRRREDPDGMGPHNRAPVYQELGGAAPAGNDDGALGEQMGPVGGVLEGAGPVGRPLAVHHQELLVVSGAGIERGAWPSGDQVGDVGSLLGVGHVRAVALIRRARHAVVHDAVLAESGAPRSGPDQLDAVENVFAVGSEAHEDVAAVNTLVMDAMGHTVFASAASCFSTFASPYPRLWTIRPSRTTTKAAPGMPVRLSSDSIVASIGARAGSTALCEAADCLGGGVTAWEPASSRPRQMGACNDFVTFQPPTDQIAWTGEQIIVTPNGSRYAALVGKHFSENR